MSTDAPARDQVAARRRTILALLADVLCVLGLAAGGYDAHNEGDPVVTTVLRIAAPFLVALVIAWAVGLLQRGGPQRRDMVRLWPAGVQTLVVTYAGGMALRGLTGHGLAPAFLVVSVVFLAVTMLGWRLGALVVARVRR